MSNYNPVPVRAGVVVLPDDALTPRSASAHRVGVEAALDYGKFLDTVAEYWTQYVLGDETANVNARFTRSAFGADYYWQQTDITDGGPLHFWIPVKPSAYRSITNVRLGVFPDVGPRAAIPSGGANNMPSFAFGYINGATGASTTLASKTDASADVAAYETAHWITDSTVSHVLDPDAFRLYWLTVTGEGVAGPNAVVGLKLLAFQIYSEPTP